MPTSSELDHPCDRPASSIWRALETRPKYHEFESHVGMY